MHMFLFCSCGHEGLVRPDLSGQRERILKRARCSRCGILGAMDLRIM